MNLYDLSRGAARQAPPTQIGREVEGVWHAGVVAYGREYSFTQQGVVSVVPVGGGRARLECGSVNQPKECELLVLLPVCHTTFLLTQDNATSLHCQGLVNAPSTRYLSIYSISLSLLSITSV